MKRGRLMYLLAIILLLLLLAACCSAGIQTSGNQLTITTEVYEARFIGPAITYFRDIRTGEVLLDDPEPAAPLVRFIAGNNPVTVTGPAPSEYAVVQSSDTQVVLEASVDNDACQVQLRFTLASAPG